MVDANISELVLKRGLDVLTAHHTAPAVERSVGGVIARV